MSSSVLTFAADVMDHALKGNPSASSVTAGLDVHLPALQVKVYGIDEAGTPQELNLQNACVALGGTGRTNVPLCDMFMCEDATVAEMKPTSMTFDGHDQCAYFTLAFLVAGNPVQSQSVLKVQQKMDLHARLYLPAHDIVTWIQTVAANPHASRKRRFLTGLTDVNSSFESLQWEICLRPHAGAEAWAQQIPLSLVQKFQQQTLSVSEIQSAIALGSRQRRDAIACAAADIAGPQLPELQPIQLPNGMFAVAQVAPNVADDFKKNFITIPVEHNRQVELLPGTLPSSVLAEQKIHKQQAMLQAQKTQQEMPVEFSLNQIDWKAANTLMEAHTSMHAEHFVGHLLAGMTLATALRMRALNKDAESVKAVGAYLQTIPESPQERRLFYAYIVDSVQMQTAADGRYAFDSNLTGLLQSKFTVRDKKGRKQVKVNTLVQTSKNGEHQQFSGKNSNVDHLLRKDAGVLGDCEDQAIHQKNVMHTLSGLSETELREQLARNLSAASADVQQFADGLTNAAIALAHDQREMSAACAQIDCEFTVTAPMICTANAANQASDHTQMQNNSAPSVEEWDVQRRGPMVGHAAGAYSELRTDSIMPSGVVVRTMKANSIKEGTATSFQLADSKAPLAQVSLETNDALIQSKLSAIQGLMTEDKGCSIRSELRCNSIQSRKLVPKDVRVNPCMFVNTAKGGFYKGVYAIGNHVMACRNKASPQIMRSPKLCPSAPCNDGNVEVIAFEGKMSDQERTCIGHLARLEKFLYERPSTVAQHILSPATHKIGAEFDIREAIVVSHDTGSPYLNQAPKKRKEMRNKLGKKIGATGGCVVISPTSVAYAFTSQHDAT